MPDILLRYKRKNIVRKFHAQGLILLMIAEYSDILASEGVSPLQGSPFNYSIPRAHARGYFLSRLRRWDLTCRHYNLRFTIIQLFHFDIIRKLVGGESGR